MGAALVVLSGCRVLAQGSKGNGCFSWCTIDTLVGHVSIGLIYAPNECARRKELWDWMSSHLHQGNWIFSRDWNMTEFYDDLVGPSPQLHGRKEQSWRRMVDSLDLTNHYLTIASRKGSIFTRRWCVDIVLINHDWIKIIQVMGELACLHQSS